MEHTKIAEFKEYIKAKQRFIKDAEAALKISSKYNEDNVVAAIKAFAAEQRQELAHSVCIKITADPPYGLPSEAVAIKAIQSFTPKPEYDVLIFDKECKLGFIRKIIKYIPGVGVALDGNLTPMDAIRIASALPSPCRIIITAPPLSNNEAAIMTMARICFIKFNDLSEININPEICLKLKEAILREGIQVRSLILPSERPKQIQTWIEKYQQQVADAKTVAKTTEQDKLKKEEEERIMASNFKKLTSQDYATFEAIKKAGSAQERIELAHAYLGPPTDELEEMLKLIGIQASSSAVSSATTPIGKGRPAKDEQKGATLSYFFSPQNPADDSMPLKKNIESDTESVDSDKTIPYVDGKPAIETTESDRQDCPKR
jgi:hypothetical protein